MNLNEAQHKLSADIAQLYQTYQLISNNKKQFNELDVALLQQQLLHVYHALLMVQSNLTQLGTTELLVDEVAPMAGLKPEPTLVVEVFDDPVKQPDTDLAAPEVKLPEVLNTETNETDDINPVDEMNKTVQPTMGLLFDLNTSVSSLNLITENEPTLDELEALTNNESARSENNTVTNEALPLFATPVEPIEKSLPSPLSEPASLLDKLTANVKVADVYQKINKEQTQSLKQAINLNKKIAFVNNLFNENTVEYAKAIEKLNASSSLHEALRYFNELKYHYNWSSEHALVKDLEQLIEKRFA